MRKFLFWPYQLYVWLIFMPLVLVLTLIASSLSVLFAIVINPNWASRYIASPWARLLALITPVLVTVEGSGNARKDQRYVVVANHQSQYDILILYGWLNLDLKWVMKKELRKVPGIGIGCEKVGHIFVDRSRPAAAKQAIADALARLGDGVGILFFAEGTRSRDGRLLPFKKGAFVTAIDQGLPVLPVTLIGTHDILPAKTMKLFPGRAKMVVHPEISTEGMTKADLGRLRDETFNTIQAAQPKSLQPADSGQLKPE